MLNQYEPISFTIKVEDLRENKTRLIEVPINTKWIIVIINPFEECE